MKTSTIERILTPEFLKSIRGEVVSKSKISGAVSVFGLVLWNEKWKAWDLFDLALAATAWLVLRRRFF